MPEGHCLIYRSLDLQDGDEPEESRIWLDLWTGYAEPAEVRGDDLVIPQKAGMAEMQRYQHRRVIELRGHVRGLGATVEERQESWRDATDELMAVIDPVLTSATLEVLAPYLGLTGGSAAITARPIDVIGGPVLGRQTFQRWTVKLMAIGNPPVWDVDESS